jgi:hypothetical protein
MRHAGLVMWTHGTGGLGVLEGVHDELAGERAARAARKVLRFRWKMGALRERRSGQGIDLLCLLW